MYASKMLTQEIRALRKRGGKWLKEKREEAGLSQRALAKEIRLPYYTFISQVENGVARIPVEHYKIWATALGVPVADFVRAMLKYYDPVIFNLLFPAGTSQILNGKDKPARTPTIRSDNPPWQPDSLADGV